MAIHDPCNAVKAAVEQAVLHINSDGADVTVDVVGEHLVVTVLLDSGPQKMARLHAAIVGAVSDSAAEVFGPGSRFAYHGRTLRGLSLVIR